MSKARLVITAVTVEKRPVGEVARSCGVARSLDLHSAGPLPGRRGGRVRAPTAARTTEPC